MTWKTYKWIFLASHPHVAQGLKCYFIVFRCELLTESQIFVSTLSLMSHRTNSQDCRNMHVKPRHDILLSIWFQENHLFSLGLPQKFFFQCCNGWGKANNTSLKVKKPPNPRWLQDYFIAASQCSHLVNKYSQSNTKSSH